MRRKVRIGKRLNIYAVNAGVIAEWFYTLPKQYRA